MRVKLTAKHPRPATADRAPVRSGSAAARSKSKPVGPKPTSMLGKRGKDDAGGGARRGGPPSEGAAKRPFAGAGAAGGKRAPGAGGRPSAGARPARPEGAATRERSGSGERSERRPAGDRPPRREGSAGAPRRADGDRPARSFDAGRERGERAPRRAEGDRTGGERAPRRFEGDRPARAPREEGARRPYGAAPRRTDDSKRPFSARPTRTADAGGARDDRPPRRDRDDTRERTDTARPRFGADRGAPGARRDSDRPARRDAASRSGGERPAFPKERNGTTDRGQRGERTFAKPVKGGFTDRSERPAREDRPARRATSGEARPPRAAEPRAHATEHHHDDQPGSLRLSKRMSELGLCSRREADEWIEKGWVIVDGIRIDTLGTKVRPEQHIEIDPAAQAAQAKQVTILLHKPVGFVSGQAEDGYLPAVTLVTPDNHWDGDRSGIRFSATQLRALAPAGRLDIDSTGLLVLTQDGRIAKQLIGENSDIDKEYLVRVTYGDQTTDIDQNFPPESLAKLRHGLSLDDVPLKPAMVSWQNGEQLRFVLREGKKRQIRRMCELVGLDVVGLKRVRMGRVQLGALPQGQWRYLDAEESF
ncbi:pseudouridine synthase [Paraburkholderia sp. GAS334]|uniref:pseudouridine synthase n=1 Tax=Paraburkholderia sp. GAS334 TaxID=3035131 RepID=UPI003D2556CF